MSVAGDIIDDLKFSPKVQYGTMIGFFGAAALVIFVVIGFSGASQSSDELLQASNSVVLVKAEPPVSGGDQRPR